MWKSVKQFVGSFFSLAGEGYNRLVSLFSTALEGFDRPTFQRLSESILRDPLGGRGVQLLATTMASIPLQVKRGDEVLEEHPILELLQRPTPRMSYANFMRAYILGLFAGGEVFLYGSGPDTGPNARIPRRLHLLQADRFQDFIREDVAGEPIGYRLTQRNGKAISLTTEEAHHIFLYNPTDIERGAPLLLGGWRSLQMMESADTWNHNLSKGGGRIPGVYTPRGLGDGSQLDKDTLDQAKDALHRAEREARSGNHSLVLSGSFDWEATSASPKDADLSKLEELKGRKLAIAMGIDPALLGDTSSKTLSNLEMAIRELLTLTALPMLDTLIAELNIWLAPKYGSDIEVIYDKDQIEALQEDMTQKYERYQSACGGSFLTPDEAREALGYEPKGHDEVLRSRSDVVLQELVRIMQQQGDNGAMRSLELDELLSARSAGDGMSGDGDGVPHDVDLTVSRGAR